MNINNDRLSIFSLSLFRLIVTCITLVCSLIVLSGCGNNDYIDISDDQQPSASDSGAESNSEKLADQLYTDPKGYFRTAYPEGWEIQEYPDDPRGKVAFICPRASGIDLRVLVNVVDYDSFAKLLKQLQEIESQMGVDTGIEQTTFNGHKTVKRTFTLQGLRILTLDFIDGNVAHNIMYSAPPDEFENYSSVIEKAMETYQPIGKIVDQAEVTESGAAKCLRLAQLMLESGNLSLAEAYVDEGLDLSPNNHKLMKLRKEITVRKGR